MELHVGDPALVDSRVVRGGDSLGDRGLVFAQSSGDAGEGCTSTVGESSEPVRQRCGVAGVEHGGELAGQVVGAPEFQAVFEQLAQTPGGPYRSGGGDDPARGFAWGR
ncbi:hypothetical protein GCM10023235_11300 [Kitasatospora terrestris]|uniref:Uncharacterized protein n=1 Tax=Kitasatospora terrestris TaxID=258051 RepID=A0ABP9DBA5_9ACTN